MVTSDRLPVVGGLSPENCPSFLPTPCFVECEHVNSIFKDYYNFENYQKSPRHLVLTEAILEIQQEFIRELCEFEFDICFRGRAVGFPCLQCGYICDIGVCGTSGICPGYDKVEFDDLCGGSICEIDFSQPPLLTIYTAIVSALESQAFTANVLGVEKMADLIFGGGSEVVKIEDSVYFLWPGRVLTSEETQAFGLFKKIFPLPLGFDICLVVSV